MKESSKTKSELLAEISTLKQKIQGLEQSRSERKQVEEALHQRDDNYHFMIENSGEGILIVQGDMIKFANPALEKILGYPRDIITTKPFVSFIHPDDRAMLVDRHMRRMSGEPIETGYRFRSIAADGTQRWLHIISRITSWNGMPASLSFVMDITDHKRAEDELRVSEEKYRLIFEYSPLGLLSFDERGVIVACNNDFVKIIGSSREKLIGLNLLKLPNEKIVLAVRNALKGSPEFYEGDYSSITAKKITPVRCLFAPIDLGGGRISGGVGIIEDITERKQAEQALREGEELYRTIFENTGTSMILIEEDMTISMANREFVRNTGYSSDEINGRMKWIEIVHPDDLKRMVEQHRLRRESQGGALTSYEFRYITKKGDLRDTLLTINLVPGTKKSIASLIDITERKQAEESLQEREEKYRTILKSIEDGYFEQDLAGNFIFLNNSMSRIYGYPKEELMGMNYKQHTDPESGKKCFHAYVNIYKTGQPGKVVDFEIIRKDGTKRHIESSVSLIKDSAGNPIAYRGIVRDITDRKQSEKQLYDTLESLRKSFGAIVQVMVSAVESRDPYTAGHQVRSADLARTIATEMELPQDKIEGLRMAGSIHDIGKLAIPAEILSKPTKLTNLEFSLIKEHARKGYEMLKDVESPWPLAQIVYQHHERMDGSGYPRNLKGDEILIEARILAVADVVEAMASHRPYRPGLGIDAALNEIEKNRGIFYDEAVVDACLRLFREKGFKLEGT